MNCISKQMFRKCFATLDGSGRTLRSALETISDRPMPRFYEGM